MTTAIPSKSCLGSAPRIIVSPALQYFAFSGLDTYRGWGGLSFHFQVLGPFYSNMSRNLIALPARIHIIGLFCEFHNVIKFDNLFRVPLFLRKKKAVFLREERAFFLREKKALFLRKEKPSCAEGLLLAALGLPESKLWRQFGVESSQIKCNMYRTSELSHAPIWVREVA